MAIRVVVLIDEAVFFYAVQANVYEVTDDGRSVPIMTRQVTTAKTEADGYEGAIEALRAVLF